MNPLVVAILWFSEVRKLKSIQNRLEFDRNLNKTKNSQLLHGENLILIQPQLRLLWLTLETSTSTVSTELTCPSISVLFLSNCNNKSIEVPI